MLSEANGRRVSFRQGLFLIDDRPTIVLCSSLFYFRIPRGLWRERMRAVRAAGYTCIDVYVPWNYHESAPDRWDFSGEHDVAAFLQLAAEEGLWVLARPGPYICSEWDGGGLPAYLLTDRALRLRDNDEGYLRHVARWFDQILPILRRFQWGVGGTVIAVQIENELDFYDCGDPLGYLEVLRDLALAHNIRVPLVACAGQGDIQRATGGALGVVPTCNFYPNDHDPGFEDRVAPYYALLRAQGLPLIVTETNRAHFLLRRLLASGAKLLGPYLQASGFNFGFTNAINNWGDPLAFMTSDYDFGGMIGPYGELRAEMGEARLLSRLIAALGPALAAATPTTDHGIRVETNLPGVEGGPRALALDGGGLLLALPNLGSNRGQVRLQWGERTLPVHSALTVEPDRCPFVLFDFALASWQADATLVYATAELCGLHLTGDQALLAFSGAGEAELVLPGVSNVTANGMTAYRDGDRVTLSFDPQDRATATIELASGHSVRVLAFGRAVAATLLDLTPAGELVFLTDPPASDPTASAARPLGQWSALELADARQPLVGTPRPLGATPIPLELAGIERGFGWYDAQIAGLEAESVSGFVVHSAGDVVSLYWGDRYQGTVVPGGASVVLPIRQRPTGDHAQLAIRAEIWGHSNFDDAQLPGLRLGAVKGLTGATAITQRRPISSNWQWYPDRAPDAGIPPRDPAPNHVPVLGWGRGQTTRTPDRSLYVKDVVLSSAADTWLLHFAGTQALVRVWVNEQPCGVVDPRNPLIVLTEHVRPGAVATIALQIERWHGEAAGEVTLLEGRRATDWSVGGGGAEALWSAATQAAPQARSAGFPYHLPAGGVAWLFAEVSPLAAEGASWTLHCSGRNAKVTAFLNGHGVGRIWLPAAGRPTLRGGHNDALYLPAPWFQPADNLVALLVEAVTPDDAAEIGAVVAQCRPALRIEVRTESALAS